MIHWHDSPKSNYLLLTQRAQRRSSLSFSCRDIVRPFSLLTSRDNKFEWSGVVVRTRGGT